MCECSDLDFICVSRDKYIKAASTKKPQFKILDSLGSNSFGNWHCCRARSLVLPCSRSLGSHCTARPIQRINASECYDLACFSRISILYIEFRAIDVTNHHLCCSSLLVQLEPVDTKGAYTKALSKPSPPISSNKSTLKNPYEWHFSSLRSQFSQPSGLFSILTIVKGEDVQKASRPARPGAPFCITPVAFSFGWVAYTVSALFPALLGDGRLDLEEI